MVKCEISCIKGDVSQAALSDAPILGVNSLGSFNGQERGCRGNCSPPVVERKRLEQVGPRSGDARPG